MLNSITTYTWYVNLYLCSQNNFFPNFFVWLRTARPAIHFLQNNMKCSQNVKNEKCIAVYFTKLFFSFCVIFLHFFFRIILHQDGILAKCQKDFTVYFFRDMKFEWNTKSVWWMFHILWCVYWKHSRNIHKMRNRISV